MSDIETRLSVLETEVAALKAAAFVAKTATPAEEVSTEKPKFDFEIKIGRDRGKKPSELSSKALESLAGFMDRCAANPQPGKEQYVESNRKAAGNYRRWAAYKRAVERGLVVESAPAADPEWMNDRADSSEDDFADQF